MAHHSGAGVPRPANIHTATGTVTTTIGLTDEGVPVTRQDHVWEELDSSGRVRIRLVSENGTVTPSSPEAAAFAERMGMPTPRGDIVGTV